MTRVVAPSRLHFGLLHVPADGPARWPDGLPVRRFGGVGLMLDRPNVVVCVERADEWDGTGRALAFAQKAAAGLGSTARFRVEVEACPPEHVGLGVGTQLGMAVARGVAEELGRDLPACELARLAGRGERSGIGVHGFDRGGLIADGGKLAPGGVGLPLVRFDFPEAWRIVLSRPPVPADWHGPRERQAFARPRTADAALRATERMCRVLLLGLLPALVAADADAFGDALFEYNRLAGEPFAADQGGVYASPEVEATVTAARNLGVRGVGQSSWGPTVFAVCRDANEAERVAARLPAAEVVAANNHGAAVTTG